MYQKSGFEVYPVIVPSSSKLRSFNFYLVKQGRSLLLIDTGPDSEEGWNELQKTLKQHDLALTDLTGILLTHHHSDHVSLIDRILSILEIPVYAHPYAILVLKGDVKYVKMRVEFFQKLYREMGCGEWGEQQVVHPRNPILLREDRRIPYDLLEFPEGPLLGMEMFALPGHAPDQVAFCHQDTLFAGDLLIEHMPSSAFIEPNLDGSRTKSVIQQKQSLEKCLALEPGLVFSGHGEVIENPVELLEKRITAFSEKAEAYLNLVKSGLSVPSEIAQFRYGDQYEKKFFGAMSETISYLDYLESEGKVEKTMKDGVWHYF